MAVLVVERRFRNGEVVASFLLHQGAPENREVEGGVGKLGNAFIRSIIHSFIVL